MVVHILSVYLIKIWQYKLVFQNVESKKPRNMSKYYFNMSFFAKLKVEAYHLTCENIISIFF